jgi:hypothetical protein
MSPVSLHTSTRARPSAALCLALALCALPALAATCPDRLGELSLAEDMALAARDASITTRRQAQDFKNALLRSGTADYGRMAARLAERGPEYAAQIERLVALAAKSGRHGDAVALLAAEREKMSARYGAALASLDERDRASVFRADDMAKGVDVPTFRQLEALVDATTRDLALARKAAAEACR